MADDPFYVLKQFQKVCASNAVEKEMLQQVDISVLK